MIRLLLLSLTLLGACAAAPEGPRPVTRAFVIADPTLVPEGIAYDARTRSFFVSSTYQRRILRVRNGAATDFTPRGDGALLGVLGMSVDSARRRLWAAHASAGTAMPIENDASAFVSGLALFDLTGAQPMRSLSPPDPGGHFLNDLAIAADGAVYISDTMAGAIYRTDVAATRLDLFVKLPEEARPNGLALSPDGRTLFIAGLRAAFRLDLESRALTQIPGADVAADGLYLHRGSLIAIQPFTPDCQVCRFDLDPAGERIVGQRPLLASHPDLLQPTTGVIVGDDFYVIANSQLQKFRKLYADHAGQPPTAALQEIVVLRVPLT